MDGRCLKLSASLLLLLAALIATEHRVQDGVQANWCYRVCPSQSLHPSTLVFGKPPLICPNLTCPIPVCPTPACPPHQPPPPPLLCSACPVLSSSSRSLPWRALKTYMSTPLGYYKYHVDKNLDWFDAQLHCASEGAHLLILNSEEEDRFIKNEMRPGWIHIGLHHLFPDGGFTTVLGKPVSSTGYNKWLPGHSVRNASNNCAFINKSRSGIGMGLCTDTGRFICEISFGL